MRWRDGEALSGMMNSTEMRCGDMNLATQRRVCEVFTVDDERNMLCGGNERDDKCNRPLILCPDGSLNKTCFPVSDSNLMHYMCLCHSARDHQMYVPTATQASWSPWKRLTDHTKGFAYTRKLYLTSSSKCQLQEFDSLMLMNIVSEYQLPHSIFSASSTWGGNLQGPYGPYRARIDMYLTAACAWVAHVQVPPDWLQIQLPPVYYVGGTLIKKRRDKDQYPKVTTVKTAKDDLQWQDVIVNQSLQYTDDQATLLFPMISQHPYGESTSLLITDIHP